MGDVRCSSATSMDNIKSKVRKARSRGESLVSSYGPGRPSVVDIKLAKEVREEKRCENKCNGWCITILVVLSLIFLAAIVIAIHNPQWFSSVRDILQGRGKLQDSHDEPDLSRITAKLAPAPPGDDPEMGIRKPDDSPKKRRKLCNGRINIRFQTMCQESEG